VRILCIDDETLILGCIARALSGHEIVCYSDSCAAISHLVSEPRPHYDVVLCDLLMPDCTGVDVHRVLTRDRPDLVDRIVFLTGATMMPGIDAFLQSTGAPVLRKPFGAADVRIACATASGIDPGLRRV